MKKIIVLFTILLGACIVYEIIQITLFNNVDSSYSHLSDPSTSDIRKYVELSDPSDSVHYSPNISILPVEDVRPSSSDGSVIPDKYNTGCNNGLLNKFDIQSSNIPLPFCYASNGDIAINLIAYSSKSHNILIENVDFSDLPLSLYNSYAIDAELVITFRNCNFSYVHTDKSPTNVFCSFENCSFIAFSGSNASFNHCAFSGDNSDGMNPFSNVSVSNSYFFDRSHAAADNTVIHTDGVQIFGHNGGFSENVSFENCRFELPQLIFHDSPTYINACIMLQLEYCSGSDYTFNNCLVNGGGYSIYACSKNPGISINNCQISNIRVGCSRKFGAIYPRTDEKVIIKNVNDTDSLYVSSIFADKYGTHIITSNDTNQDRTLLVETNLGSQMYSLPACPTYSEVDSSMTFEDFPFDIDCLYSQQPSWVACYDISNDQKIQIRYVTFE